MTDDLQNTATPTRHTPKDAGESLEYLDRERRIDPSQPRLQFDPVATCSKVQFDSIRSPMTLLELLQLLGKPSAGSASDTSPIAWMCEDGRALSVCPNRSHNPQQLFHGLKLEQQDFGSPEVGQLTMARGLPNGKGRFYLIPKRKAGEVEEAIRNHGRIEASKPI